MIVLDSHPSGRHFLQIPGPSPVPDRILRAMSLPTIDHRGPEFAAAFSAAAIDSTALSNALKHGEGQVTVTVSGGTAPYSYTLTGPADGSLHLNYRYYRDNWGIRSHTAEVAFDQPLGGGWMLSPQARYYSQSAASFYAPYFTFNEAYPAHPGGPLDRDKIPLKYFSSDERLSAFGAVSGSLALQKDLGRGVSLDLSYEYYLHKGSLKLGGGGEGSYADFHSSLVTAGLSMDLARRQDALTSAAPMRTGAP